jgi:hypothetical protein
MSLELEEKIERKLFERRLGEVVQNLQKLSVAMQKDSQSDEKILAAIQENSRVFSVFLDKFQGGFQPNVKVEAPNVKVETNQDQVVASIREQNDLLRSIITNQQTILELSGKKPNRLQVERNNLGFIKHIDIQY